MKRSHHASSEQVRPLPLLLRNIRASQTGRRRAYSYPNRYSKIYSVEAKKETYPSDGDDGSIVSHVEPGPSGRSLTGTSVALATVVAAATAAAQSAATAAVNVLLQALVARLQLRVRHPPWNFTINVSHKWTITSLLVELTTRGHAS